MEACEWYNPGMFTNCLREKTQQVIPVYHMSFDIILENSDKENKLSQ